MRGNHDTTTVFTAMIGMHELPDQDADENEAAEKAEYQYSPDDAQIIIHISTHIHPQIKARGAKSCKKLLTKEGHGYCTGT